MPSTNLQIVDPTEYPAWDSDLLLSGDEDFFHTAAWARVLKNSYGYEPVYFVCRERTVVTFTMPFMAVSSPLTGRRGVSLPFTDRCAPFFRGNEDLSEAVNEVKRFGKAQGWRYVEWRDSAYFQGDIVSSESFLTHDLTLDKHLSELYRNIDDSNRRNIQKAKRENVSIKIGRTSESLESFYRLHCLTRRRHGMPPQPLSFFRNVFAHVISPGLGIVVLASHSGLDIAAAVFFHFGRKAIYKFGASDPGYLRVRPNNLVMWEAIQWFGEKSFSSLTLGRTELDNPGLLRFKRAWTTKESPLRYYRFNLKRDAHVPAHYKVAGLPRALFARAPMHILRLVGKMIYKHVG